MGRMKGVRRLAAFLGCLAAISAMLPVAAFAWTKAADAMPQRMAMSQPCPHCHDCDPCQTADNGCSQVCVSPLSTLGSVALPVVDRGDSAVPGRLVVLHGLSRPPDPFPPRS